MQKQVQSVNGSREKVNGQKIKFFAPINRKYCNFTFLHKINRAMKTHFSRIIFCLLFVGIIGGSRVLMAQESSDSLRISSSFFSEAQYDAWNKLYDVWRMNFFHDCLSQNNLHIDCAHCGGVYMNIVLTINDQGYVANYKIIHESMCGNNFSEKLKICFLTYFLGIDFPKELRNLKFEVHLGSILKC